MPALKPGRLLNHEWDAIAGLLAAVIAIVLHLLHVVDETVVLPILLALLALLFLNFMRHARSNELTAEQVVRMEQSVGRIESGLQAPDVVLIGPRQLRTANQRFLADMQGDTVWYNVCLSMYAPRALFDALLRPAIDNPQVTSIQFVLDESQRSTWESQVRPQIAACAGCGKVTEPRWQALGRNLSFVIADNRHSGRAEALLSFWGEPFMAQSTARDVPRFMFHVQAHSALLPHLVELQRAR